MSPWAPASPCRTCQRLGCREHPRRGRWDGMVPRQVRGYGSTWDTLRRLVLQRDNYTCQVCGTTTELQVDHVQPKSRGGQDVLENLVTICMADHARKTAREGARAAMRTTARGASRAGPVPARGRALRAGPTDSPAAFGPI